jgi:alanine-glyoxylate transaminase/serine-glyoxylate transaminase/serine-pyruvate transaminase
LSGRHFLQIPGPTNVPERVLRAMDRAVPDHRGSEMPALTGEIVDRLRTVFGSQSAEIVLYPGSGTAGWEASLVNTLSPGDHVLAFNAGHFSHLYAECARQMGFEVEEVELDWGMGVPADVIEDRLRRDAQHTIRAVMVVHNETSAGTTTNLAAIRKSIDAAGHPALLLVDAVSSLGSIEFQLDKWGVDVALTGAQKGLMLPPGMAILAVGERGLAAGIHASSRRYFLDWRPIIEQLHRGYLPYTPATLLLYGLREALRMLDEEGLTSVYRRHQRLADGVRTAVSAWDLGIVCRERSEQSNTLTAVVMPDGVDSDAVLQHAAERYELSLGMGLGKLKGRVFRIGHLGSLNELEVLATFAGTELSLRHVGVEVGLGSGVSACQKVFEEAIGVDSGPPRT